MTAARERLVAVLLLAALGAVLFALRLLTIRVREVREPGDEPGDPDDRRM
jgi:hypothetical protein